MLRHPSDADGKYLGSYGDGLELDRGTSAVSYLFITQHRTTSKRDVKEHEPAAAAGDAAAGDAGTTAEGAAVAAGDAKPVDGKAKPGEAAKSFEAAKNLLPLLHLQIKRNNI